MRIIRQMFGPITTQSRVRLTLEALDLRLPLSSLSRAVTVCLALALLLFTAAPSGAAPAPGNDAPGPLPFGENTTAPQIVNFQATQSVGGFWVFSGTLIDAAPGGLTVTLGGQPASLQGVTTTTDANGHFSGCRADERERQRPCDRADGQWPGSRVECRR